MPDAEETTNTPYKSCIRNGKVARPIGPKSRKAHAGGLPPPPTRAQVLAAAGSALKKAGLANFSVSAVAREGGLAEGSVYNLMGGRQDLVISLYEAQLCIYYENFDSFAPSKALENTCYAFTFSALAAYNVDPSLSRELESATTVFGRRAPSVRHAILGYLSDAYIEQWNSTGLLFLSAMISEYAFAARDLYASPLFAYNLKKLIRGWEATSFAGSIALRSDEELAGWIRKPRGPEADCSPFRVGAGVTKVAPASDMVGPIRPTWQAGGIMLNVRDG